MQMLCMRHRITAEGYNQQGSQGTNIAPRDQQQISGHGSRPPPMSVSPFGAKVHSAEHPRRSPRPLDSSAEHLAVLPLPLLSGI
ncbi:hypothetical protein F511_32399 [Dorcoceras hygrometricum]|uniref:Uncharacterized protein n=1 Tax=Dorcoceras hygrometricum TaxID=472368 RepID=A0A2Z7CZI0_9LAMI|nr:hypothetical protein F511_32399 [Dorcoceras hygrometricum]